jgi:predicted glycogen debranching enzyme
MRPAIHFRPHEAPVNIPLQEKHLFTAQEDRFEITVPGSDLPPLRMQIFGEDASFTVQPKKVTSVMYRTEESRGYEYQGDLWSCGHFWADLSENQNVTFVASTENWTRASALSPDQAWLAEMDRRRRLLLAAPVEAQSGLGAELVLAADQFIITPATRVEDAARARAAGEEARTVIAGYHWFTDWGRDTMISLEGLTLQTGRFREAGSILHSFAQHVRDGLIPNMFPEGDQTGLYHTADATLWFFHALGRYLHVANDRLTLERLMPILVEIIEHHIRGTKFNIHMDSVDSLLVQGEQGYQLTWMDAKMGDWVVTPRRGKAVEINALWYNALQLLARWLGEVGGEKDSRRYYEIADRAKQSFNKRFWYQDGGHLYDVVDCIDSQVKDDPACRPNQIFAISLPFPVLDESRWSSVMEVAEKKLLTPVGLRSLSPDHPDYKAQYFGDLRNRDGAYHQGTVWGWLIGPFVDAWLKVNPGREEEARKFLDGFNAHLGEACVGSISEIFDAQQPYVPRGCIAQAWSVAEVLRCWVKTAAAQAKATQAA